MPDVPVDPKFFSRTSFIQVGYGLWVSLVNITIGMSVGFSGVIWNQLRHEDPPIQMKSSDEAWIAGVLFLFAPIGCIVSGIMTDKFGRRINLIVCVVPLFIGWLYTGLATSVQHILIGRAITGIGYGMAMSAPLAYLTEICLPNIRGVVGIFPNIAEAVGFTLQTVSGSFLKWRSVCFIAALFSAGIFCLNFYLHETPYFNLLRRTDEGIKKSLKRFRADDFNVQQELDEILDFKLTNNFRSINFTGEIKLIFAKSACKPFWIIFIFIFIMQISGTTIILIFAIDFFKASNILIDTNIGYFAVGGTKIVAGIFTSILMYRISRRPLALVSSFGFGLFCIMLGAFVHYKNEPSAYPLVFFTVSVAFATAGYYTLPFLIMFEIYPLQARGLLSGITLSMFNIMVFGMIKAFSHLKILLSHATIILFFGAFSLLGFIYLYFFLPETKDLTLQEIEEYFNGLRSTLVSQRRVIAAQMAHFSNISSKSIDLSKTHNIDKSHKGQSKENDLHHKKKKVTIDPKGTDIVNKDKDANKNDENDKKD